MIAEDQLAKLERQLKKRFGELQDANNELALIQQAINEEVTLGSLCISLAYFEVSITGEQVNCTEKEIRGLFRRRPEGLHHPTFC